MNQVLTPAEIAHALFNPAKLVDELGLVKAQIAELEAREKALKQALVDAGQAAYAGTFYDATVSHSERENFDTKRLREDLGADTCAPYVKAPSQIVTVRVVAKK